MGALMKRNVKKVEQLFSTDVLKLCVTSVYKNNSAYFIIPWFVTYNFVICNRNLCGLNISVLGRVEEHKVSYNSRTENISLHLMVVQRAREYTVCSDG
jgi:hypothetical protein